MREIVGCLVEFVVAAGGRSGKRPENGDAGDVHRRAERVGGQSGQIAVRELAAGLVDGARGERRDVADRDSVIGVVESRGSAGRVQRTGAARVAAIDAVETVADAQLFARRELMIDLTQEVAAVN